MRNEKRKDKIKHMIRLNSTVDIQPLANDKV